MCVILAVDIVNGKVVKAFAGLRMNYKPLFIQKEDFSDPIKLIKTLQEKIELKKIYIADLDAIRKIGDNNMIIEKILKIFSDLLFLIDAGFDYPRNVYNYHIRKIQIKLYNYKLVLGTETIKNFNLKSFQYFKKFELSIDFNGSESYWLKRIMKKKTRMDVTLMFLKKVGGRGLNMKVINSLYKDLSHHNLSIAGGIRTNQQVKQLFRLGFSNVLSSTLLHKKLSRDNF